MGFPADAVQVVRNTANCTYDAEAGFWNQFVNGTPTGRTLDKTNILGSTTTASVTDPYESYFPFYSNPVTVTSPISGYILDGTGSQVDLVTNPIYTTTVIDGSGTTPTNHQYKTARNAGASTFSFTGGDVIVKIYPGAGTTMPTQPIQTVNIHFDDHPNLPVPLVVRTPGPTLASGTYSPGSGDGNWALPTSGTWTSGSWAGNGPNANPSSGGNPYKDAEFYTGINRKVNLDTKDLQNRLTASISGSTVFPLPECGAAGATGTSSVFGSLSSTTAPGVFRRGDVIRSIGIDPNGPTGGDIRLVAGLANVPSNYFKALANYSGSTYQVHSMLFQTCGNANQRGTYGWLDQGGNPYYWTIYYGSDMTPFRGDLVTLSSGSSPYAIFGNTLNLPTALTGQHGAYLGYTTTFHSTIPGDWDNGLGNSPDGGYLNKADEGYAGNAGNTNVYFDANMDFNLGGNIVSFSPNRQIASAVMFGSLPTGVLSGTGWETLLFCPNPAAKTLHPGFGRGSGPTAGPSDFAPYTIPPDHLLLDWFWMPIVQPYAISDPISTAGKVNMNYQILPFTNIERSTAVRAVLKNVKVMAIPLWAGSGKKNGVDSSKQYKGVFNAYLNADNVPSMRYDINRDETIRGGFDARFNGTNPGATPDIFRSASEICNIFLVPQEQQNPPNGTASSAGGYNDPNLATAGLTYLNTASWWDNFSLTGDNSRESPYNQIYPRLTTKSNTFQVHYRVQLLKKLANSSQTTWTEGVDQVVSEYRGSSILERYIDPNDPRLLGSGSPVDFTQFQSDTTPTPVDKYNIDKYYKFRVISTKVFTP